MILHPAPVTSVASAAPLDFRHLVIGGTDAPTGRYPYAVSLVNSLLGYYCMGSLIAPDLVLASAHCGPSFVGDTAVINPHNFTAIGWDPTIELFTIIAERDAGYNIEANAFYNDAVLLQLDQNSTHTPVKVNDDPEIPSVDQTGLRGVGWETDPDFNNDILQQTLDLQALSNERCVEITIGGYRGDYRAIVSNQHLCTTSLTQTGNCGSDSGGPLIIPGDGPSSDLQVGISDWNNDCGLVQYPNLYTRTSALFAFIRHYACRMSTAPPDYFQCSSPDVAGTFSPVPSSAPTANTTLASPTTTSSPSFGAPSSSPSKPPTASPTITRTPTSTITDVTVTLNLEASAGWETGWRIETSDGQIVHEAPPGTYHDLLNTQPSALLWETLPLTSGGSYVLILSDAAINGFASTEFILVSLSSAPDSSHALLFLGGQGIFTGVTRRTFTVDRARTFAVGIDVSQSTAAPQNGAAGEALQEVTLLVFHDAYPEETGWTLLNDAGVILERGAAGAVDVPFTTLRRTFYLKENATYTIRLTDVFGDGVPHSRAATILLGTAFSEIVLGSISDFNGLETSVDFTVGEAFAATPSPAAAPMLVYTTAAPTVAGQHVEVTLWIFLDVPKDIGWKIFNEDSTVVAEMTPGSYNEPGLVEETVRLAQDATYIVTIFEPFNEADGIGTPGIAPSAFVFLGSPSEGNVLAILEGESGFAEQAAFIAGQQGIVAEVDATFTPTASPTFTQLPSTSITPTSPSTSLPTGDHVTITVRIALDAYPGETSWGILDSNYDVVYFTPPEEYLGIPGQTVVSQVELNQGHFYTFALLDAFGDGMFVDGPAAILYFGSTQDPAMRLGLVNGNFNYEIYIPFVADVPDSLSVGVESLPSASPATNLPSIAPTTTSLVVPAPTVVPTTSPPVAAPLSGPTPEPTTQPGDLNGIVPTEPTLVPSSTSTSGVLSTLWSSVAVLVFILLVVHNI